MDDQNHSGHPTGEAPAVLTVPNTHAVPYPMEAGSKRTCIATPHAQMACSQKLIHAREREASKPVDTREARPVREIQPAVGHKLGHWLPWLPPTCWFVRLLSSAIMRNASLISIDLIVLTLFCCVTP